MKSQRLRLLVVAFLLTAETGRAASPAPVAAKNGMVVTAQQHATRIGVDVLRNGGNAIDAAVAVGYALAVVYPAAGNLGGGGFMTLQLADGRKTFIDFRETAPLAATASCFSTPQGNVIPDLSTRGHLAVAVPGTVSGLEYAREKYGTMARARLIAPSITLAERGFVLEQGDVDLLHEATDDFRKDAAVGRHLPGRRPAVAGGRALSPARPRPHPAQHQPARHRWFLPGRDRRRADCLQPRGRRNPHAGGSRRLPDARARTRGMRLPRVSHRVRAAAELRRHRAVRNAEHPRGLSTARIRLRLRARRALRDRGHAPRLCRPQPPARRSGLREQSDRATARQALRRHHPRAESIRSAPAIRRSSSPASQHAKARTPLTTRSPIASATPSP